MLFKTYTLCDPRVRPLLLAVKRWAKARRLDDVSQLPGTVNSYTHVLTMLFYLQIRGVIPPLQRICCGKPFSVSEDIYMSPEELKRRQKLCLACGKYLPSIWVEFHQTYFYEKQPLPISANSETVAGLLLGYFWYYAYEFDHSRWVVCPRLGRPLPAHGKQWDMNSSSMVFHVEDPFVTKRNCASTVNKWSLEGFKWEWRRAWRLLLDGDKGLNSMLMPWTDISAADYLKYEIYRNL